MAIAQMIRDLRKAQRLSQGQLAQRLHDCSGVAIGRERISRWERLDDRAVIPSDFWLQHLAGALNAPVSALRSEATLSRMERRDFMRLAAATAGNRSLPKEMVSSIAGSDSGPLATVQATHEADLVIASLADRTCRTRLRRWMREDDNPLLRVNAAGILAKVPGQDPAAEVCRVLTHDDEVRRKYTTAVISRVCGIAWETASRLAVDPESAGPHAATFAALLATEVTNTRDAGARWCSAAMLRDISPLLGKEPPCT